MHILLDKYWEAENKTEIFEHSNDANVIKFGHQNICFTFIKALQVIPT